MNMTLSDFLAGPGGDLVRRLGLPADLIAGCTCWARLTAVAIAHNSRTDGGVWRAAERLFGVLSSGERAVLLALLGALDFSSLADQLAGRYGTWTLMDVTHGRHRDAVAACILRRDP